MLLKTPRGMDLTRASFKGNASVLSRLKKPHHLHQINEMATTVRERRAAARDLLPGV